MELKSITIDRQYGSGGREIGKILSKRLGIPYYDGELLLLAAEKHGLNPGVLKDLDEKPSGSVLYGLAMAVEGYKNLDRALLPYKIFQAETETIRRLAAKQPCVFIGRCADWALKETGGFRSVFIYASNLADRTRRANENDGIPVNKIEAFVKRKDKQRKDYYNFHTQMEWGEKENYDLCLNSSIFGYKGCAELIIRSLSTVKEK